MSSHNVAMLARVSQAVVARHGLRGLSLRVIAHEAGVSLGSLSYHMGDKAGVIARLIDHEVAERRTMQARWRARLAPLDLNDAATLAAAIELFLDDAVANHRDSMLTGCELVLHAVASRGSLPPIAPLLVDLADFWTGALAESGVASAEPLGRVIAGYLHDEMPFTLGVGDDADYRLLRRAGIARIAGRFGGGATGLAVVFPALVDACGTTGAGSPIPVDLPHGSRRAELAGHIADIIVGGGLSDITHRAVAARAGVPNSSVAHHYRTADDLVMAGLGALIVRMRQNLGGAGEASGDVLAAWAVIRSTHALALAAARDPAWRPFALDMRRRRAENVTGAVEERLVGIPGLDRCAIQAWVMARAGSGLAMEASGGAVGAAMPADLVAVRAGRPG